MLIIGDEALQEMTAHAEEGYPHEVCGLLLGEVDAASSLRRVRQAKRASNLNLERAMGINQTGQIAVAAHSDDPDASVGLLLSPIGIGIPGDLDGDGQVGASDLLILLTNWGPCADCDDCAADLDRNCVVGARDLLILLINWG